MTQRVLHIYQWKRSFLHFSLFSQQMAEKIGNEMQTQGIKMKRPAIPTKVCRFPSLPTEWYYSLRQKVFRSLHFLTHRRPTLQIWRHIDPSPHSSLVKDVQSGAKMFWLHFQHCSLGEKGEVCWVNSALQRCILKLDIQRGAFFEKFLSKIVDFVIICFLYTMVVPTTSDHQLHHYFLSLKRQKLFSILQLLYLFI